jgi:hypothetical protein
MLPVQRQGRDLLKLRWVMSGTNMDSAQENLEEKIGFFELWQECHQGPPIAVCQVFYEIKSVIG